MILSCLEHVTLDVQGGCVVFFGGGVLWHWIGLVGVCSWNVEGVLLHWCLSHWIFRVVVLVFWGDSVAFDWPGKGVFLECGRCFSALVPVTLDF